MSGEWGRDKPDKVKQKYLTIKLVKILLYFHVDDNWRNRRQFEVLRELLFVHKSLEDCAQRGRGVN